MGSVANNIFIKYDEEGILASGLNLYFFVFKGHKYLQQSCSRFTLQNTAGLSVIFHRLATCSNRVCQRDAATSGMSEGWGKGSGGGEGTRAGQPTDVTEKLESRFLKVHAKICTRINV